MKKSVKYSLFISVIFIILGAVIVLVTLINNSFWGNKPLYTLQILDLEAAQYDRISISESDKDIIVKPSSDDKIHISYYTQGSDYSISTQGSELNVTYLGKNYGNIISFDITPDTMSTTVELPENILAELFLTSASGELKIDSVSAKSMSAATSSGDIEGRSVSAGQLTFSTVSGEAQLYSCSSDGILFVETTSGDVNGKNLSSDELNIVTVSGDVELNSALALSMSCETISGDIDFEKLDCGNISLNTVSGDIGGTVAGNQSQYDISWSSVSGNIDLPSISEGRPYSIFVETTSGNCRISFEN
jgi:DUF4097 and DUF4098 domain-containing protein YvlB